MSSPNPANLPQIEHIVVLMFENRSFDHVFGALPNVNGVVPQGLAIPELFNTRHPTEKPHPTTNPPVAPTPIADAAFQLPHDFNHDFYNGMMPDLFGPGTTGYAAGKPITPPPVTYPPTNSGFLSTMGNSSGDRDTSVMSYFELGALKVLHPLALEFVVCDNWFCDMPGHTNPNRYFMHCATTSTLYFDESNRGHNPATTIFNLIQDQGRTWGMYTPGGQVDSTNLLQIADDPQGNLPIAQFCADLDNGTLPFYSFLMCWSPSGAPNTSMHPAANIRPGENYLAAVYNQLRQSALWEKTLLIVTFDENGGIYDHVPPPEAPSPYPGTPIITEHESGATYQFDFTLLGPRIPVLLISPWLAKGVVDSTLYHNTSILRFIEDLLIPPDQPLSLSLTARDASAPSIGGAFRQFGLSQPRLDCPETIEGYAEIGGGDIRSGHGFDVDEERGAQAPMPHMVEVAKEYAGGQSGHADSGKPITREFPTNALLNRYVGQRDQAARWYHAGAHLKAAVEIVERAPGQWIWQLKDADGTVVAAPRSPYQTRQLALRALDLVRFLFHEWCCTP